jgi:hypothetical protein
MAPSRADVSGRRKAAQMGQNSVVATAEQWVTQRVVGTEALMAARSVAGTVVRRVGLLVASKAVHWVAPWAAQEVDNSAVR